MFFYVIQFLLLLCLFFVCWQDIKERKVYWFLFLLIGAFCAFLNYEHTLPELFVMGVLMNSFFIFALIIFLFLYSKFKLKMSLGNAIGWGDILLFFAFAFSFSTISFIVIFISSLIFSLILHLTVKKKSNETVPLAGYMSLFFATAYIAHWAGFIDSVYKI